MPPEAFSEWTLPPGFRVSIATPDDSGGVAASGGDRAGGIGRLYFFSGVDRVDRLECDLVGRAASLVPALGAEIRLRVPGASRAFVGNVDSVESDRSADGSRTRVVALAALESRRREFGTRTFASVTDSEVAAAVADALGLAADLEPTSAVRGRVVIEGDPLVYLKESARALGFQFAVDGGTLRFRRELRGATRRTVDRRRDAILSESWSVSRRGAARGKIALFGDPTWTPLTRFALRGFGRARDGVVRAERVLHVVARAGYRTEIEFRGGNS